MGPPKTLKEEGGIARQSYSETQQKRLKMDIVKENGGLYILSNDYFLQFSW